MMRRVVGSLAVLAIAGPSALAQRPEAPRSPIPAPAFERTVKPGAAGPNHLPVDLPLLVGGSPLSFDRNGATTGGLGELRLIDGRSGREVPYLLEWPRRAPELVWQGARIVPVAPGRDTSGFEADLGRVFTVDRLEITHLPERFLKRVRLEGSGDRVRWTMLVPEGTLFNLPPSEGQVDRPLQQTQLAFAAGAYRYLRVIWDDHAGGQLSGNLGATARIAPRRAGDPDTLRAPLALERRPSELRKSRYHVRLPASRLPIIALELQVGDKLVLRPATVTEPQFGADRLAPAQLGGAVLRRVTSGDAVAANLRVPIEAPQGAELDLIVDDGDNPPLDVRSVSAVFAPLPYVYFESPDGRELRASYGGDRRQPISSPRYDLEALRDTVEQIVAVAAAWDAPRALVTAQRDTSPPSALHAVAGASLDAKSFPFARAIPPGSGLTAIRLDPAALAHGYLKDLRVVDAQGRQVPYVLEQLGEPTEVALPAPVPTRARENIDRRRVPDAATRSWYRVSLPHAGLPGATLRLTTGARVFARDVAIVTQELPREAQPDEGIERTLDGVWAHDDPDSPTPPFEVALGDRLPSDSLFVLVNDGDNQKVPLTSATLLLPTYRVRFFRQPGAALVLLYGRKDLGWPTYDLALLRTRIVDAPATEVTIAPESGHARPDGGVARLVFWGVLGLAVVVLLVMIGRLVRGGPIGEASDAAS